MLTLSISKYLRPMLAFSILMPLKASYHVGDQRTEDDFIRSSFREFAPWLERKNYPKKQLEELGNKIMGQEEKDVPEKQKKIDQIAYLILLTYGIDLNKEPKDRKNTARYIIKNYAQHIYQADKNYMQETPKHTLENLQAINANNKAMEMYCPSFASKSWVEMHMKNVRNKLRILLDEKNTNQKKGSLQDNKNTNLFWVIGIIISILALVGMGLIASKQYQAKKENKRKRKNFWQSIKKKLSKKTA